MPQPAPQGPGTQMKEGLGFRGLGFILPGPFCSLNRGIWPLMLPIQGLRGYSAGLGRALRVLGSASMGCQHVDTSNKRLHRSPEP